MDFASKTLALLSISHQKRRFLWISYQKPCIVYRLLIDITRPPILLFLLDSLPKALATMVVYLYRWFSIEMIVSHVSMVAMATVYFWKMLEKSISRKNDRAALVKHSWKCHCTARDQCVGGSFSWIGLIFKDFFRFLWISHQTILAFYGFLIKNLRFLWISHQKPWLLFMDFLSKTMHFYRYFSDQYNVLLSIFFLLDKIAEGPGDHARLYLIGALSISWCYFDRFPYRYGCHGNGLLLKKCLKNRFLDKTNRLLSWNIAENAFAHRKVIAWAYDFHW